MNQKQYFTELIKVSHFRSPKLSKYDISYENEILEYITIVSTKKIWYEISMDI